MNNASIPIHAKKVGNREIRRRAERAIDQAIVVSGKSMLVLLSVLAQSGGEVTVTEGTLEQVSAKLGRLDFAIVDGPNKGESIVRLVENDK